jgi:hypothetical protein
VHLICIILYVGGFLYFGSINGAITKINLTSFTIDVPPLPLTTDSLRTAALDSTQYIGYFGATSTPSQVFKVDLFNMTLGNSSALTQLSFLQFCLVDTVTLSDGLVSSIVIDQTTNQGIEPLAMCVI